MSVEQALRIMDLSAVALMEVEGVAAESREPVVAKLEELARTTVVMRATEPEEIDVLIEELISDPRFHRLRLDLTKMISFDTVRRALLAPASSSSKVLESVAGDEFADLLRTAQRQENALLAVLLRAMADRISSTEDHRPMLVDPVAEDPDPNPMAWMMADVPPFVKRAFLGMECGSASIVALASCRGLEVEGWIRERLLRVWIAGTRDALRLFSSFPGAQVGEDVLPTTERLDVKALNAEYAEAELGYHARLQAARESGWDVFPPFPGPFDE